MTILTLRPPLVVLPVSALVALGLAMQHEGPPGGRLMLIVAGLAAIGLFGFALIARWRAARVAAPSSFRRREQRRMVREDASDVARMDSDAG